MKVWILKQRNEGTHPKTNKNEGRMLKQQNEGMDPKTKQNKRMDPKTIKNERMDPSIQQMKIRTIKS